MSDDIKKYIKLMEGDSSVNNKDKIVSAEFMAKQFYNSRDNRYKIEASEDMYENINDFITDSATDGRNYCIVDFYDVTKKEISDLEMVLREKGYYVVVDFKTMAIKWANPQYMM